MGDLLGRRPVSFSRREPLARHLFQSPPSLPAELLAHRSLRIERVVRETRDAVSLHLADPAGAPIEFTPGQFLTLLVTLRDGRALKRAYSLSAIPGQKDSAGQARITIKRVGRGKVSGHLNEHVREGDVLTVLGPSGSFGISREEATNKHLLLIGGGSGITPLRSILEPILADPSVLVTLLYGNRAEADVIFRAEIDGLAAAHPGRFVVRYVLELPPEGWTGGVGLLDRTNGAREIAAALASDFAGGRTTEVLVCGPTPMMAAVHAVLANLGFPAARVREERFSSPDQRKPAAPTPAQPVTIKLRGKQKDTVAAAGQTLLEAGVAAGLQMPFSCTMGGCGACKVKLVSGRVVSDEPNCLSNEERSQGFILACVSRATAPVTLEVP
jgi:ring-1,2-phenylacetyl-CoA epoxidase subunit PaaE